ncbi:MAG: GAF domain-containing protein, partial [Candidatus Eisenbacteria bacterium]|nr:GAF domain-containing protein [Candidatus Eisenbacteria bacterium]
DLTRGRAIAGKLGLRACYQEAAAGVLRGPARRARLNDLLDGSLAILGRARRVSRSYIFVNDDERGLMTCRNEWAAPGVESFLGMTAAHGDFPYWLARLRADLPVVGGDILRDLPEEVHEILTLQGIVSILVVPLRVDRRLWGFLGLDECAARREWSRLEVSLLGEFGDLIACLIGRRRSRGARPAPAATANT